MKLSMLEARTAFGQVIIAILFLGLPACSAENAVAQAGYKCRINEASGYDLQFLNSQGKVIKTIRASESKQTKGSIIYSHLIKVHGCARGIYGYVVDWHTRCDATDDDGCGSVNTGSNLAVISVYASSGERMFRLKKVIASNTADNFEASDDDGIGVFVTSSGVMGVRPSGQTYDVSVSRPFYVSPMVLSPNGEYVAVSSSETGVKWLMIDLRSSRIESFSGAGEPEISDQGDFLFYVDRARRASTLHPGKLVGDFHFKAKK